MPTVELRFTPLPAHVRTARLLAAAVARRTGVDEALIDEVKLAVGEACTRAVSLHQAYASSEEVVVELTDDLAEFVVCVRDRGPRDTEPAVITDPHDVIDLATRDETGDGWAAGFGLAVIAGLVDDVQIIPADPGTTIRMAWAR